MKFLAEIFIYVFTICILSAKDTMPSLKYFKENHNEIFTAGNVSIVKIDKADWYIITGVSEKLFLNDSDGNDNSLYNEAVSHAKSCFFKYLKKDSTDNLVVKTSGMRGLFYFHQNRTYYSILGVPVKNVLIDIKSSDSEPLNGKEKLNLSINNDIDIHNITNKISLNEFANFSIGDNSAVIMSTNIVLDVMQPSPELNTNSLISSNLTLDIFSSSNVHSNIVEKFTPMADLNIETNASRHID